MSEKKDLYIGVICAIILSAFIAWIIFSGQNYVEPSENDIHIITTPTAAPDPWNYSKTYTVRSVEDTITESEKSTQLLNKIANENKS